MIRQVHRWLSLLFVVAAVANIVALIAKIDAAWLGLLAVIPLIPLMITGLCMFVQPYLRRPA